MLGGPAEGHGGVGGGRGGDTPREEAISMRPPARHASESMIHRPTPSLYQTARTHGVPRAAPARSGESKRRGRGAETEADGVDDSTGEAMVETRGARIPTGADGKRADGTRGQGRGGERGGKGRGAATTEAGDLGGADASGGSKPAWAGARVAREATGDRGGAGGARGSAGAGGVVGTAASGQMARRRADGGGGR
eukprot:723950-Pleurochrysis_carterae.AAC.1